jgi:ribosomal protein S18 acetylase RimI-like enzyme
VTRRAARATGNPGRQTGIAEVAAPTIIRYRYGQSLGSGASSRFTPRQRPGTVMTAPEPPYFPATPDDADALAQLVNMAGEGLPLYLWEGMAEPGQTAWDVGRSRARRDQGAFSYRNAITLREGDRPDGAVIACLIGYDIPDKPEAIAKDMPAMFVPLQELENLAPGTWYVNVLATFPEHRGKGLGGRLLEYAEAAARAAGRHGLSVIVEDANSGARRLYERCGFRETARRRIVKDDWISAGTEWVLLVKEF